jgi:hypothetical protein
MAGFSSHEDPKDPSLGGFIGRAKLKVLGAVGAHDEDMKKPMGIP